MKDGLGTLGEFQFTNNSSWIYSFKFCLGIMVSPGYCEGVCIREAKTYTFTMKDYRGETMVETNCCIFFVCLPLILLKPHHFIFLKSFCWLQICKFLKPSHWLFLCYKIALFSFSTYSFKDFCYKWDETIVLETSIVYFWCHGC